MKTHFKWNNNTMNGTKANECTVELIPISEHNGHLLMSHQSLAIRKS